MLFSIDSSSRRIYPALIPLVACIAGCAGVETRSASRAGLPDLQRYHGDAVVTLADGSSTRFDSLHFDAMGNAQLRGRSVDVTRVRVEGGRHTGTGTLVGLLVGAVGSFVAVAAFGECDAWLLCLDQITALAVAPLVGGVVGAGVGSMFGHASRDTIEYHVASPGPPGRTAAKGLLHFEF